MAFRFVRSRPDHDRVLELRDRLAGGDSQQLEPFWRATTKAVENARFDPETGEAVPVEEDYCTRPRATERGSPRRVLRGSDCRR